MFTGRPPADIQIVVMKKSRNSQVAQLTAVHSVALLVQFQQIQTFATQRHKHTRSGRRLQSRPMLDQHGVSLIKVKADVVVGPLGVPVNFIHWRWCPDILSNRYNITDVYGQQQKDKQSNSSHNLAPSRRG